MIKSQKSHNFYFLRDYAGFRKFVIHCKHTISGFHATYPKRENEENYDFITTPYSAIVQESLSLLEPTQLHFEKPRRSLRKHVGMKLKVVKDFLPQSFIVDGYQVENFRLEVVSALRGKGDKSINRVMTGGSIGKDFLRQFIVTYDFHNMRFDLEPIQMIIEGGKQ